MRFVNHTLDCHSCGIPTVGPRAPKTVGFRALWVRGRFRALPICGGCSPTPMGQRALLQGPTEDRGIANLDQTLHCSSV